MKVFTVTQNCKLSEFTDNVYPQGSFCCNALLKNSDIKVNGKRVNKNIALSAGDIVTYYTTPAQESKKSHDIIFEDKNIYIADKHSGVSFEGLLSELKSRGEYYAVHRLDRNTEGLIAFAKNSAAEEELLSAFKNRNVKKRYIALCKNGFKRLSAVLEAYLKKDESAYEVKIYDTPRAGAVKIITEYKVLENRGDIALVEVVLHTGRTHQIRAHMAHIGCPVLGDGKYGDGQLNKKYNAARQRLVSKYLQFGTDGALKYLNGKIFESKKEL